MPGLQLGYLGFNSQVSDLTVDFFENILGATSVPDAPGGRRLRIDDRAWRFAVEPAEHNDLSYLGLDVPNLDALAGCVASLREAGFEVTEADPADAAERRLSVMFRSQDPDGLEVELGYGAPVEVAHHYVSPFGAQFVTGSLGLGHVVLSTRSLEQALRFYGALGFRTTDVADIPAPTGEVRQVTFLRCNPRHHSLALVPADMPRRLRHIMVELATVDDVGRAFDRALSQGLVSRGLGRHVNDGMLSFYATAPGEIEVEIGCQGRLVDDEKWSVSRYAGRPSSWGHQVFRENVVQVEK